MDGLIEEFREMLSGPYGREIGYALIGRANDLHDNPDEDFEHVAEDLRDLGRQTLDTIADEERGKDF